MALLEIASLQMSLLKVRSCWSTTRAGPGPEPNGERPGEMRTDTGGHIGTEAETGGTRPQARTAGNPQEPGRRPGESPPEPSEETNPADTRLCSLGSGAVRERILLV